MYAVELAESLPNADKVGLVVTAIEGITGSRLWPEACIALLEKKSAISEMIAQSTFISSEFKNILNDLLALSDQEYESLVSPFLDKLHKHLKTKFVIDL